MPIAFPGEFRDDVVAIARRRDASFAQIAKHFGISETTVQNWVSKAEVERGVKPGVTSAEYAENRELRKRVHRRTTAVCGISHRGSRTAASVYCLHDRAAEHGDSASQFC